MLLSLMLGLGGGLGLAYLLENLDDVIDTIEEAERVAGLATLGVIPLVKDAGGAESALADAGSPMSEAYRSLCTSLQFTTARGLPKTLLVTSAGPAEGKSITSMAIAQHFARLGLKVLIIDADMRKPSLHVKLRGDNSVGLSSYLTGACEPPDAMQKTELANLAFMPSGPLPPNAADVLGGSRLMSLLAVGLEVFDLIVIDGPPVIGIADAPLLSNATEATVFVIGAGVARAASVRGALKRLEISKSPVIGSVVTQFDAKRAGYGYGYGYGYGHGNDSGLFLWRIDCEGRHSASLAQRPVLMSDVSALKAAIELFYIPSQVHAVRLAPLPKGTTLLLRLAAGDAEAAREAQDLSDRPADVSRQAAIFFIQQILLYPDADSYRILGSDRSATPSELRNHMALLLKWLHPDLNHDRHTTLLARRVIRAWDQIKTPERRRLHDEKHQPRASATHVTSLAHRQSTGTQCLGKRPRIR